MSANSIIGTAVGYASKIVNDGREVSFDGAFSRNTSGFAPVFTTVAELMVAVRVWEPA